MKAAHTDFEKVLRRAGFRSTNGRIALLQLMEKEAQPLTIEAIHQKLAQPMSVVTVYRALEALAARGVVRRIDLGHTHAHYEFQKEHHHHIVCTSCGTIEDVAHCDVFPIERSVAKKSSKFGSIESHSLEFFGRCGMCTAKSA